MICPRLQTITLTPAEVQAALERLETHWQLPDGSEVVDARSVSAYVRQLAEGHYLRLVWPDGTTKEQANAWYEHALEILDWHKRGLL